MSTIDKSSCDLCEHHSHSVWDELVCHIPYAGFSLALGFTILSLLNFVAGPAASHEGYHVLFHSFHYLHIILAVVGTTVTFFRYSRAVITGVVIALIVPTIFCVLSDVILPTLAGKLLGVHMHMHICFMNLHDSLNMLAFAFIGLLCGLALLKHKESLKTFSICSHFLHILVSSMASLFYMVGHGFETWYHSMGILFLFLFVAVVVPCTLSDVVVPLYFARNSKRKN